MLDRKKAKSITSHMGVDWNLSDEEKSDYRGPLFKIVYVPKPDRHLTLCEYQGHLIVSGSYVYHDNQTITTEEWPDRITINPRRDDLAIARDLLRRFATPFLLAYSKAEEKKAEMVAKDNALKELQADYERRFGLRRWTTNPNNFSRKLNDFDIDIRVNGTQGNYATYVTMRHSMDRQTFEKFMEAIVNAFPA